MRYVYRFDSCDEIGKCPYCGKRDELFLMTEQQEYYNKVLGKTSFTDAGCFIFDLACKPCLTARQRNVATA